MNPPGTRRTGPISTLSVYCVGVGLGRQDEVQRLRLAQAIRVLGSRLSMYQCHTCPCPPAPCPPDSLLHIWGFLHRLLLPIFTCISSEKIWVQWVYMTTSSDDAGICMTRIYSSLNRKGLRWSQSCLCMGIVILFLRSPPGQKTKGWNKEAFWQMHVIFNELFTLATRLFNLAAELGGNLTEKAIHVSESHVEYGRWVSNAFTSIIK